MLSLSIFEKSILNSVDVLKENWLEAIIEKIIIKKLYEDKKERNKKKGKKVMNEKD
jgi:hypothetical protein